jgi:hypothetical protein
LAPQSPFPLQPGAQWWVTVLQAIPPPQLPAPKHSTQLPEAASQ